MRKSSKTPYIFLLAILILVAGVVVAINLFADHALKIGIEAAGTKALNVGVSVGDYTGPLKGELKKIGELSEALLDRGGGILKEGKDLGKEVTEDLKGLFGPKKKEE